MKRIIVTALLITLMFQAIAQDETEREEQKGFRRDNIFIGGSIALGIGSGTFSAGANPEVGYSVAKWLDAGISTNINYFSARAESNNGYRQRSTTYGAGVFTRIYPFNGFFVQALPEYNWIKTKVKDFSFPGANYEEEFKQEAPSFLLGVGYGRRAVGQSNFFTAIMFDVGNNPASPYIDSYGAKLPILRTGFNVYLRPKSQR
jgi:hypothetical protein